MKRSFLVFSLTIFLFSVMSSLLFAYPGGVSGYTRKGPNPGCGCHTSNVSSSVTLTFSGPTTLNTGETGNYSVLMTYTSTINGGGMDIAASSGTLAKVDNRLKVLNGELTQPSKQTGTTQLVWNFKYTAPATAGQQTLYATGCAVKNRWNHAPNYLITVTAPNPASLSILTPVTGNSLLSGDLTNITWNSANVANVKLEYSTNSGTNWMSIIGSTPAATGSYYWTVPETPSQSCVVRVSNVLDTTLKSVSGVFSITVPIPEYNISHLRLNNSSGVSQDTGKVVTVRGVVTVGNEFNSPSFIQDSTGGLAVFGRGAGQFSSSVKIGDLVKVTGKVVNYNGLTEINPVTEFLILDSGVTTQPEEMTIPDILTQVWDGDEAHEGKLVKIMEVVLSSYTPIWEGNTNYIVINGTDSLTIRILNGTELVGQPAPNGSFNLTGVISQYKASAPYNGGYELIPRFIADINITTAIGDKELNLTDFRLDQNFPNPFNPSTMISFSIPVESSVTLQVFNSIGEVVALLTEGMRAAGRHSLNFNAEKMVSGVYFYKLTAQPSNGTIGFSEIKKLILLK